MDTKRLPIEAYSFESYFELKEVPGWGLGVEFETRKTNLVGNVGEDGIVFVFDFGALVFVNVKRARVEAIVAAVCERHPREPHAPLREDFALVVDPGKAGPSVAFDAVVLPKVWPLALECVATVLAQSASIDYYDEGLRRVLDRVQDIADDIAKSGRLRRSRSSLARFVGSSIGSQVEMIQAMGLLDKPDFTWDDEAAEKLYDVLRHHFEIPERYRALETKLTTIRESMAQFLEMSSTRWALFLEATIVLLIVFEIVMSLAKLVPE